MCWAIIVGVPGKTDRVREAADGLADGRVEQCTICRRGIGAGAGYAPSGNTRVDLCKSCARTLCKFGGEPALCCPSTIPLRRLKGDPAGSGYYCPACPGQGKLVVLLIHPVSGEERLSYHPASSQLNADGSRITRSLSKLAQFYQCDPNSFVFTSRSVFDWGRRTLRVAKGHLPTVGRGKNWILHPMDPHADLSNT